MQTLVSFFRRTLGTPLYVALRESSLGKAAYWLMAPSDYRARWRWLRTEYRQFNERGIEYLFLSIARFAHINRPINGYYMEFGCHSGTTMRAAWSTFRHLFDWDYVGFDSFEGLPDMDAEETTQIFRAGQLATAESDFRRIVESSGMPKHRLHTVKGFYQDVLNEKTSEPFLPKKAAVIYVDCDLYSSAKCVLSFCRAFLQVGTTIVFDDWNCYCADPEKGERRAWREFLQEYPEVKVVEFVSTCEAQAFVIVSC